MAALPRAVGSRRTAFDVAIAHANGGAQRAFLRQELRRAKLTATASKRCLPSTSIALRDALKIKSAIVDGFDWGTRTANIMAALWPDRVRRSSRSAAMGFPILKRMSTRCRQRLNISDGMSFISSPNVAALVMTKTPTISTNSSGSSLHRSGTSPTRPTMEAPQAFAKAVIDVDAF